MTPMAHDRPQDPSDGLWDRLAELPDLDAAPVEEPWMAGPPGQSHDETTAPPDKPAHDPRRVRIGAPTHPTADPSVAPEPAWPDEPDRVPLPTRRRRSRPAMRVVGALVAVLVLGGASMAAIAWFMWNGVEKVDTDGALSPHGPAGTNYLIVGTDSRAGVSSDLDTAASIGLGVGGERSDTMLVLHIGDNDNHMLSLPRDLWVTMPDGSANKLNAARAIGGVPLLIRTVTADPGIPIQHYLEVDLAGFLSVVEAVGSITINFPRPACDPKSGLDIRQTGPVALDAEQALAYVRSRRYTEFDAAAAAGFGCDAIRANGLGTEVGNADFGRTERQRAFLLAVFDKVSGTRNPITVLRALNGLSDGLRVDESMGVVDAFNLLRDLRGLDADALALPVSDLAVAGQSALQLNAQSAAVLELFEVSG
jgi:LCP family protein required for cell wall assembly